MTSRIFPYGLDQTLQLQVPAAALAGDFTALLEKPISDPAAATAAALDEPLEYPELAAATVPGDRVLVALGDHVPQAPALVAGLIHSLLAAGVPSDHLTLLHTGRGLSPEELLSQISTGDRNGLCVVEHNIHDRAQLAYLAASEAGLPIYINREISDADVVFTIGCLRVEESLGWTGVSGSFFPSFSDEATRQRYAAPTSVDEPVQRRRRRQEAEEATWLLGLQCTVQVVPGPNQSVLHVVAGETSAAYKQGSELCQAAWNCHVEQPADLVLASLTGDRSEQTWDNLAKAIYAGSGALADGGSLVLCTQLDLSPDPALRHLRGLNDLDAALHEIRRERTPGAATASQLVQALSRVQVYLQSKLPADTVEELGIGCVDSPADIDRLLKQHERIVLLPHAQHAVLRCKELANSDSSTS